MQDSDGLNGYYRYVKEAGSLPTKEHARRWSAAVLKTLGMSLGGRTKRSLARALPEELGADLTDIFWLLHFRNKYQTLVEFSTAVGRRSGNTDDEFAVLPIRAVFGGLKALIESDLERRVADSLPPQIAELWRGAPTVKDGQ
ncbi:MAG: DUF2267 domain-containing protein [Candidatus Promineifilaceae bacterium]